MCEQTLERVLHNVCEQTLDRVLHAVCEQILERVLYAVCEQKAYYVNKYGVLATTLMCLYLFDASVQ